MRVDFDLILRANKATRGDLVSICELIHYYTIYEDWVAALKYMELLVDYEPSFIEKKYQDISGYHVPYEKHLGIIGLTYIEQNDYYSGYRWYQKYLDYLDFKNRSLTPEERQQLKVETAIYKIMVDADELDKIHNRFLLKWEQDLFYKNTKNGFIFYPKEQYNSPAKPE